MMKLTLLALLVLSVIIIEANYKDYCNGKDYLPTGKMLPHLHCGANFFHLSYYLGQKKHAYFVREGIIRCEKVKEVWKDPNHFGNFKRIKEIRDAIHEFGRNVCNLDLQLKDEL